MIEVGDITLRGRWRRVRRSGLHSLGNWSLFTEQGDSQTREHDAANETTGIDATVGDVWITPEYDAAGNMILAPKPGAETTALHLKYDAWNHLVAVYADDDGEPGDLIAEYQYDSQNRRVAKIVREVDGETVTYVRTDFEYNENWQCLEERTDTFEDLEGEGGARTTPAETVAVQYLWDIRYVDAPVLRWRSVEGTLDEVVYFCNDANMNVTALIDAADGSVVERCIYTAYGEATCLDLNWANGQSTSRVSNVVLYTGHPLDEETGLVYARERYDHTTLGRWLTKDPLGVVGGMNPFQAMGGNPLAVTDPYGLLVSAEVSLPQDASGTANIAIVPSPGDKGIEIILDDKVICSGPVEAGSIWDCPFNYEQLRAPTAQGSHGTLVVKVCNEEYGWEQHLARYEVEENSWEKKESRTSYGAVENLGLHALWTRASGYYYKVIPTTTSGQIRWPTGAAKWADNISIDAGATFNPEAGEGFIDVRGVTSSFGAETDLQRSTLAGASAAGGPSFQRGYPPATGFLASLIGGAPRQGQVVLSAKHSVRGKWFVLGQGGRLEARVQLGIRASGAGSGIPRWFSWDMP